MFFPDLNAWLALSVALFVSNHSHIAPAWNWLDRLGDDTRFIFPRYTQVGWLRLLTNVAVMGDQRLILGKAWGVYDRWLEDPRVEFYPEPREADSAYRKATELFAAKPASKWVGDYWLLAFATGSRASLVTFDHALIEYARKNGLAAVVPA